MFKEETDQRKPRMSTSTDPGGGPDTKNQGPFSGFAVYASPESSADTGVPAFPPPPNPGMETGPLSGFAVYATPDGDDTAGDGAVEAADDERYIDPEDLPVNHGIRMRPGSSLSIGHRNVYRTDRRGVPHFAAGWTPAAAGSHYRRISLGAAALAAATAAAAVLMSVGGIGSDSTYTDLAASGIRTSAVVSGVHRTTTANEGPRPTYLTVEETTFSYDAQGPRTGRVRTETTDALPPLAQDTRWEKGDSTDVYVSTDNPEIFTPVDPDQPGRVNALTLLPLFPMAAFATAAGVAGRKSAIMASLDKVDWKPSKYVPEND